MVPLEIPGMKYILINIICIFTKYTNIYGINNEKKILIIKYSNIF